MFRRYAIPDDVGWLGWFEDDGKTEAFVGLDRRVLFVHEIRGCDENEHETEDYGGVEWQA